MDDYNRFLSRVVDIPENYIIATKYNPETGEKVRIGHVYMVFGNEGWDVITDYSAKLKDIIKPALELSAKLKEQYS